MTEFIQQTINAISLGGTYALLALGLALVFSILGFINFAHGSLMTLGGYALYVAVAAHVPFALAVIIGLIAAAVAAVIMERVAFRPVRGSSGITVLITSFAVSVVLLVAFQDIFSPQALAVQVPPFFGGTWSLGDVEVGRLQVLMIAVAVAALLVLTAVLRKTMLGTCIRAIPQDFDMTRLMGVDANRLVAAAFAVSGLLAGIAGVFLVAQSGTVNPSLGTVPVVMAFIAVVVGGLGSLSGAVFAGFLVGALEVYLQAYLPASIVPYQQALVLAVLVVVLVFRPYGLRGSVIERS